jgi:hypothetical protein
MTPNNLNPAESSVLGQKYAFATASLIMGIACYVNLLGLEKAILAIMFAWMALKQNPAPVLRERRGWAKAGVALGSILLVMVPTVLLLNLERLRGLIAALEKLQDAK